MPARIPDEQIVSHFWSKVNKDGPVPAHRPELGPCWVWTACVNEHGYGVFSVHRRIVYAHRFAYQLDGDVLANGVKVRHHCDNGQGGCVRPSHMTTGTQADNIRDAVERGRFLKETCKKGHRYEDVGFRQREATPKRRRSRECNACQAER